MRPTIHRDAVPLHLVTAALRLVWADLMRRGILPDEVANYRRTQDWFPWLKDRDELQALRAPVAAAVKPDGEPCRPQLVVQFPDDYNGAIVPHVDATERGREYRTVVGVALTPSCVRRGGLHWWKPDGTRAVLEPLQPGDVVAFPGGMPHASGANVTAYPRVGVYLRWQ